jgi:hypothetical protein
MLYYLDLLMVMIGTILALLNKEAEEILMKASVI